MRISEEHELEKVMLEDKMKMTDWEATNEAIEEQIARESYVEWLKENERKLSKNKKIKFTATATATTTTSNNLSSNNGSPKWGDENKQQKSPKLSPRLSPKAGSSGLNNNHNNYNNYDNFVETGTFVNHFPPQMFGMSDSFDDGDILRQVLAQSQQEYLDSLKRKAKEINSDQTDEASSSGLNSYNESSFSCSSGLNSSPNKKLKVNNEPLKEDEFIKKDQCKEENLKENVNEIVNKKIDKERTVEENVKKDNEIIEDKVKNNDKNKDTDKDTDKDSESNKDEEKLLTNNQDNECSKH